MGIVERGVEQLHPPSLAVLSTGAEAPVSALTAVSDAAVLVSLAGVDESTTMEPESVVVGPLSTTPASLSTGGTQLAPPRRQFPRSRYRS